MKRRNFVELGALAITAIAFPKLASPSSMEDELLMHEYTKSMTIPQKIDQILMHCANNINEIKPDTNFILMGWSFPSGIYKRIVAAAKENAIGSFISVDQEGGRVYRLTRSHEFRGKRFPSMVSIGKMPDKEVFEEGVRYGSALKQAGVNMLLTSLDSPDPNTKMYRDRRVFGTDVKTVEGKATNYFNGVREAHPLITIFGQHFPIYNVSGNTDGGRVVDHSSLEELTERSKPFFNVNVDGLMISSITYSAITNELASLDDYMVDWARTTGRTRILMCDDFRGIVKQKKSLKDAAIKMFNTDMDLMLMVLYSHARQAHSYLKEYIEPSEEAQKKLNYKVTRILLRKYQTGLFEF